jgi:hypothetical protein
MTRSQTHARTAQREPGPQPAGLGREAARLSTTASGGPGPGPVRGPTPAIMRARGRRRGGGLGRRTRLDRGDDGGGAHVGDVWGPSAVLRGHGASRAPALHRDPVHRAFFSISPDCDGRPQLAANVARARPPIRVDPPGAGRETCRPRGPGRQQGGDHAPSGRSDRGLALCATRQGRQTGWPGPA